MGQRRIVDEAQRLAIVISAAIVVCMELFQVAVSGGAIKKELIDSAERSATEISRILEFPLYTLDNDQAQRIGEVMLASRRVSGITIRDSEGNAILDRRHSPPSRRIPSITRAVQREGLHLGVVYLEFSDAELDNSIRRSLWTTLSVILGIVLANIIAFRYIFTLRIAKPFASIVAAIGRIGKGDYDGAVPRSGYGDVDLLIDRFNHMAAAVKEKSLQLKEANDLLESRVRNGRGRWNRPWRTQEAPRTAGRNREAFRPRPSGRGGHPRAQHASWSDRFRVRHPFGLLRRRSGFRSGTPNIPYRRAGGAVRSTPADRP
jgi:methyl-accepting chemotaxis protein